MGASGRESARDGGRAGYEIEGSLLEACQCGVLCPCWLGEDPDEGDCRVVLAFHLRDGHVGGLDVSGLTVVQVVYAPGNLFAPGSWRVVRLIDERAGGAHRAALLRLFRGELGGPLSALASLVDREVAVESAPIHHSVVQGQGRLAVPDLVEAVVEPFRGPDGTVTTLRDSRFSMAPGAPAWVAQAVRHRVSIPRYGMVWDFAGRNAIQLECTWRSHDG